MSTKGGSQRKDRLLAQISRCMTGEDLPRETKRMSAKDIRDTCIFLLMAYELMDKTLCLVMLAGAKKVEVTEEYKEIVKETEQEVETTVENWQAEYLRGGKNATDTTSGTAGSEKLCE